MLRNAILSLLLMIPLAVSAALSNQLKDHPSPYLAMHGDDPVRWQSWGKEVLELAQKENKLIFVSSGYFACHWCHVMQLESYRNDEIAAQLNEHFIPVKIDRELLPALDAHLIDFVRETQGTAGWPLNVFLTPEGYPVVGLTYAPPEKFLALLMRLDGVWNTRNAEIIAMAKSAVEEMQAAENTEQQSIPIDTDRLKRELFALVLTLGDDFEGGIGHQNKFPMSPLWQALLSLDADSDELLDRLIKLTLDQMASKGLYDQLAGGFFRYTVDQSWRVPHFEKMLYTQALQAELYLSAGVRFGRQDYLDIARATIDFVLNEFAGEKGGFIASLSAVDADGHEGVAYLWTEQQLVSLLNEPELAYARQRWGLVGESVIEQGYLPIAAKSLPQMAEALGQSVDESSALEAGIQAKLLADRVSRAHPKDDKQLAAWNGLMLSTLVQAAEVFQSARYRQAANRLGDYLRTELWDGERLLRAKGINGDAGQATLEDYAFVADGLIRLGALNREPVYTNLGQRLMEQAWQRYYREAGWQSADDVLIPGVKLNTALSDNPLPSPIAVLTRLTLREGDDALKSKARKALQKGYLSIKNEPLWYASHVAALLELDTKR